MAFHDHSQQSCIQALCCHMSFVVVVVRWWQPSAAPQPRSILSRIASEIAQLESFGRQASSYSKITFYLSAYPYHAMASKLKILVPVKRVIDYAVCHALMLPLRHIGPPLQDGNKSNMEPQVKPRVNKAQTAIETNGVKHSMNPFDELSVEEAVRMRERKQPVDDILAWSAGPQKSQDILRTAMAMGADRAIHVEAGSQELEPLQVAKLLKKVVEEEERNLVILGKQSIDDDANQTGQMLAGLLGWSQATQASKVDVKEDGSVEVMREVDGGVETLKGKLPMIITTDLRLNEPRYASLPNIMKAKKKPMVKKKMEEYGIDLSARLKTVKVIEPPPRQGGGKVEDVDGMIGKLKELGAI